MFLFVSVGIKPISKTLNQQYKPANNFKGENPNKSGNPVNLQKLAATFSSLAKTHTAERHSG